MRKKFNVILLLEVYDFFDSIDNSAVEKILYNIDKSQSSNDVKLFTKLSNEIWEFRTLHRKTKYKLLGFWDKTDNKNTLVIATNGFIKKTKKTPKKELDKAQRIRKQYFSNNR